MSAFPKLEIKSDLGTDGIITEIWVDGNKIPGVRRFELKQEVGDAMPVLTLDINALNLSVNSGMVKMNHYGMGGIKNITFDWQKNEEGE